MFKKQTKKLFSAVLSFCLVVSMLIAYVPVDVNAAVSTAALKFRAGDLSNGKIFVKIGDDERIQLDSSEADSGGAIWKHDIAAEEQKVVVTAEPNDGYEIDGIAVFEGEDSSSTAFEGSFDSENGSYSFPLHANTYVIEVNFVEEGAGGPGGESGRSGTPETGQTASLKFSASDLTDLKLTYKIDLAGGAEIPAEDETPYGVATEVDGAEADGSGAIWICDFLSGGQVTITAELKDGVEGILSDKISNIYANEGEEGRSPAYNGFFSFNEDGSKATYFFDVSAMTYEVRVDSVEAGGGGSGGEPGEDPGPSPEHYGENSYISMSTHNEVAGDLYYAFADSAEEISEGDWNQLSVEGNFYEPIDMSLAGTATKMFLRIDGKDGKHLDVDGELIIAKEGDRGSERIYRIGGTYNNDPNYDADRDGKQLDGIGLSDLYNNRDDNYIIPFAFKDYKDDAIFMEFHWVDVTTINVEVDEASQYMLEGGKAEIGIATGKGFQTKVDDEAHVSIPVLPDSDMGGVQERYLVDIKIKREYFVPEFSFNGHTYETFVVGNIDGTSVGTDEYAYIAAAIPAKNFKQIMKETGGSLVIHLTVDKQVGVVDSQGNENEIQAAFRMIDDGNIPETTSMAELDADMQLEADSSDISAEERVAGYLDSYDITMELDGANAREFPVAINILIPGDYSDNIELVVVREHEGEAPEELGCVVEEGNVIFQTAKFSRFTVKHAHNGTKVNQVDATCTSYGVKAYYKCSCGKCYADSACTKEITDLVVWKSGDGRIEKKKHTLKNTTTKATLTANGKKETKCTVCGKVTKTETIYAAKTIKLSATKYIYDGKVKKPSVTIKDSKGNAIASTNYTVTYPSGRKNVGKYTVKVTFKGNYSGSKSLTFTINPPKTSISKVTAGKKAFTVKWSKKTTQVTGYEIQYSTSSSFAKGNKTVKVTSAKTVSKTISKLTGGKKYYVRIRTYKTVGKIPYYSDWSVKKSVTTK